jgi:hypothetical protein
MDSVGDESAFDICVWLIPLIEWIRWDILIIGFDFVVILYHFKIYCVICGMLLTHRTLFSLVIT